MLRPHPHAHHRSTAPGSAVGRRRRAGRPCLLLAGGALLVGACADPVTLEEWSGPTMGTTWNVKVAVTEPLSAERHGELRRSFEELLRDLNQKMSTWLETSELSELNRFGAGEPLAVSADLLEVMLAAEDVYRSSGGAFDPTVGPLVNLWGFGPDARPPEPPPDDEITAALSRVGWSGLRLDQRASTVLKTTQGISIDLSAIAKGYAVDRLAELLLAEGLGDHLVEVGGEIRVAGHRHPVDGTRWTVGIEAPARGPGPPSAQRILGLAGGALATSGDYRNFYENGGVRYSHTIDPRTGRPVAHRGASVTVHADTCMRADAMATALMVMGPDRGYVWAEQRNVAALFLIYNRDGSVAERRTPAMNVLLVDSAHG